MKFFPLLYRIGQKMGIITDKYEDIAVEKFIICPEEVETKPSAIFFEEELEKVKDVDKNHPLESERKRAYGYTCHHHPTIGYKLHNVYLVDGCLYASGKKRFRYKLSQQSQWFPSYKSLPEVEKGALVHTYFGNRFFGHWIKDKCPLALLAKNYGISFNTIEPDWPHIKNYKNYWEIDTKILKSTFFRTLTVFEDFSLNSSKGKRYRLMRRKIQSIFPPEQGQEKVFIKRGNTGSRIINWNENEIAEALNKRGFVVVDVADGLETILQTLSGSKLVVGLEGSHLSHSLFSIDQKGSILVIQPPYRFSCNYKEYTDCFGLKFGFVVGEGDQNYFTVDLNRILQTIDLMLQK